MESQGISTLTADNVLLMCTSQYVRQALAQPLCIHKIIIEHDGKSTVDNLFDSIFNIVEHFEFCPTSIEIQDKHISFNVQRCRSALERLFLHGLILQEGPKISSMKVQLAYKHADIVSVCPMQSIAQMIEKRINDTTLNLEAFSKDVNGTEIYISFSNLKCIGNYLHHYFYTCNATRLSKIETIRLANNSIKYLNGISFFPNFARLSNLNLRNNLIDNIHELSPLRNYNITELWLDGNPLCKNYQDECTYIAAVKKYCPHITKLDGVQLKKSIPQSRRNFVCVNAAVKLVDQFMEHYFTVYDTSTRMHLLELYHKEALFSLSCANLPTSNIQPAILSKYIPISRNILKLSDITRGKEHLHVGSHNICTFLDSLPRTQHDPYTFTADLVQHTPDGTILTITGIFREIPMPSKDAVYSSKNDMFYNFCRTFRMKHCGCDEFRITNETLFITNTTTNMSKLFTKTLPVKLSDLDSVYGLPTEQEKKELCKIMSNLTQMSDSECKKYLENTHWNIKDSIQEFIKQYPNINK